jgi:ankyrin repeat protein
LLGSRADTLARDRHGRTPLHVVAFAGAIEVLRTLVEGGGDIHAREADRSDVITIAAVADNVPLRDVALQIGGNPRAIMSHYDGTALSAAAHLGHDGIVRTLIKAGAPLDRVNNLGRTALTEAVVLGNGGPRHVACARALVEAGAKRSLGDRQGLTPRAHAERRGYDAMVAELR